MPRNEKGSFRGSSDQRGERPRHLHNCRISEHGLQPGHLTGGCPSLARELRTEGRLQTVLPRGQKRGLPRERDTEAAGPRVGCWGTAAVPDGRKPSGAPEGANPPLRGQAVPRGCCRCGGGAAGDRLPAPTRRHLRRRASTPPPRWLSARRLAPPPASGDKGIKRHARSAGRGRLGRLQTPVPPERLPRPRGAAPGRPRQRGGTGRARGRSLFP